MSADIHVLGRVAEDHSAARKKLADALREIADKVEKGDKVDGTKCIVLLLDDRGDEYNFATRTIGLYGSEAVALLEIAKSYYCRQLTRSS